MGGDSSAKLGWLTCRCKCDERLPCGHCVNRGEECERPSPRLRAVRSSELSQQPESFSPHVNTLHIELFHHFAKVTQYTLTYPEIWETQLQESFKVSPGYLWGLGGA